MLVVHLSPDHKSHLAELLQPHVGFSVEQVTDVTPLEVNRVYVIPPGRNLSTIDSHLRLSPLEPERRERAPIDHFFRTLAKTHNGNSAAVILTGTGGDGTLGIQEIKAKGGLTVAQDPAEAEYDGMPRSAIASGFIDLVLPLNQIADRVVGFLQTKPRVPIVEEPPRADSRPLLQSIFTHIRTRTGNDFSHYKRSTIMRRVRRRMQLSRIEELDDYLSLLREKPEEVRALAEDFLITVTSFFRDPEVFAHIERVVIPEILASKAAGDSVRVWSVGCSTGEEAYSVAMLLLEQTSLLDAPPLIHIFASDLHARSLKRAREGVFPEDIQADVSPERLRRFFVEDNACYRIRKESRFCSKTSRKAKRQSRRCGRLRSGTPFAWRFQNPFVTCLTPPR